MLSDLTPNPALTPYIHAAIEATKRIDLAYWERLCGLCDPRIQEPLACGVLSLRTGYTGTVEAALGACEWSVFDHSNVPKGAQAFRTFDLQGWIQDGQGRRIQVPFVTVIVGSVGGDPKCLWNLYPGPPSHGISL